jgi:hypothetical protein
MPQVSALALEKPKDPLAKLSSILQPIAMPTDFEWLKMLD